MLREALANRFQRQLPEYLDGMVTIVSVKVSADLSLAKVYVSLFNTKTEPEILVKRLNAHQSEIRTALAADVSLRRIPEFRFYRDDTLDAAQHIEELLQSVREEDARKRMEQGRSGEVDEGEMG